MFWRLDVHYTLVMLYMILFPSGNQEQKPKTLSQMATIYLILILLPLGFIQGKYRASQTHVVGVELCRKVMGMIGVLLYFFEVSPL